MEPMDNECARLVQEAAGVVAAANGKVKISAAMRLVGFSTPERRNMTTYQQVRRKAMKMSVVEVNNEATVPAAVDFLEEITVASTLTAETRNQNVRASFASSTNSTARTVVTVDDGARNVRQRLFGAGSPESATVRATGVAKKAPTKKNRRSSKQAQRDAAEVIILSNKQRAAMKYATRKIQRHKLLPKGSRERKSINTIIRETNELMGSNISANTAARYVRNGLVGRSPMKRGPVGDFPKIIYNALKGAYTTFLKLEQAHGKKQSTVRHLARLVNGCVNRAGFEKNGDDLTRKLKRDTADQFTVGKTTVVEARRQMWTTAYNLNAWFSTWKDNLIELGFGREATAAEREADVNLGELHFFDGQKDRIINVDETDGSLDDTTGQRGGRPAMTFYSEGIAGGGTAVNKSGYSATVICGSTASGDPIPPHFQLKTLAQTDDREKMGIDWFVACKDVYGRFGHDEFKAHPCTFGLNEKAGMNAVELHKYVENSILPLYPDLEDIDGKRVIMKVDSGPGRMNEDMLAELRLRGFYMIPGVPNTTHVTQETDQNYGFYKSIFRDNLRILSQARFDKGLTLIVADLPLMIFGGRCQKSGVCLRDAFSEAFAIERNLSCWKKCGSVPLTRRPLQSDQVRHEIAEGSAAMQPGISEAEAVNKDCQRLHNLEEMNRFYCDILHVNGYGGMLLRKCAPKRKTYVAVTQPRSFERINAIKEAKTAGQVFFATGGRHLNSDEFFQARALAKREDELKVVQDSKDKRMVLQETEAAAKALLASKGIDLSAATALSFTVPEIKILLKWKGLKFSSSTRKAEMIETYTTGGPPPLAAQLWTLEEEQRLVNLQSKDVAMIDTTLGVKATQMANAVKHNLSQIDEESKAMLLAALQNEAAETVTGATHAIL